MESVDICQPIKSFEELFIYEIPTWAVKVETLIPRSDVAFKNSSRQLCAKYDPNNCWFGAKPIERSHLMKTLVCHDMKGGYIEDKYVDGCDEGYKYVFRYWNNIDIFVYFSHEFITIPPLGWINIAHRNGVKILGTIITEGKHGYEICSKLFNDEISMISFSQKLVEISQNFKLDGWLLNFENPIKNVDILLMFVQFFTQSMHEVIPHSEIIWYDSITSTGHSSYQNELNSNNKCFFDACDGIFLNYLWNISQLKKTLQLAGTRHFDVYVGIDVFGRKCDGQFKTCKALKNVYDNQLSCAIFAPGWTFELTPCQNNNFFKTFLERDSKLWNSLWPYLNTYPITNDKIITKFYLGTCKNFYNLNKQELNFTVPLRISQSSYDSESLKMYLESGENGQQIFLRHLSKNFAYVLFDFNIKVNSDFLVVISTPFNINAKFDLQFIFNIGDTFGNFKCIYCNDEYGEILKLGQGFEEVKQLENEHKLTKNNNRIKSFRLRSKSGLVERNSDQMRLIRLNLIPKTDQDILHINFFGLIPFHINDD